MKAHWNKIRRELFADGRKLFVVTSLLAVMLLLWGRLLLKDVPRTAVAKPSSMASRVEVRPESRQEVQTDNAQPAVSVTQYEQIQRDLFGFKAKYYPLAGNAVGKVTDSAKSGSQEADETGQQQRLTIMAAAKQLKLQSTMEGANSRALINGVLLEPGQTISGFTLKEVRSRQVVLVKEGIEVVLEM